MKTPFQELMASTAEFRKLKAQLFVVAGRHYVRGADAEDAISDAFRIGYQRELAGQPWDPKREKAIERFGSILGGIIANKRRGGRRKPTRLGLEQDDDAVSESANADELLLEFEDEAERTAQGDKVRARLAKQTDANGLTLRVIDACRDGIPIRLLYSAPPLSPGLHQYVL